MPSGSLCAVQIKFFAGGGKVMEGALLPCRKLMLNESISEPNPVCGAELQGGKVREGALLPFPISYTLALCLKASLHLGYL